MGKAWNRIFFIFLHLCFILFFYLLFFFFGAYVLVRANNWFRTQPPEPKKRHRSIFLITILGQIDKAQGRAMPRIYILNLRTLIQDLELLEGKEGWRNVKVLFSKHPISFLIISRVTYKKPRQQEPLHPDNEFESPQRTSSIGCFASSGNLLYSGHLTHCGT